MRVRFQRNVRSASARAWARLLKRGRLGMLDLFVEIESCAGDFTRSIDYHRTDQRTGTNLPGAARRQLERASHHLAICFSPLFQSVLPSGNEVSTTCMSGWVQESTCAL